MSKHIYLDYNATTPLDPKISDLVKPLHTENFGNAASSGHQFGQDAKKLIERSRNQIAKGYMSTVIGIFEDKIRNNKSLPVVRPGTQKRTFTHIEDTIEGCYYAYIQKKNRHYALSNNKSLTILQVANLFGGKINFIPQREGSFLKEKVPSSK